MFGLVAALPSGPLSGFLSWLISELCSQPKEFICEMELTLFMSNLARD
jgi:hypothetical protein